jgi:polar amino acid transport system ATP-binding protein
VLKGVDIRAPRGPCGVADRVLRVGQIHAFALRNLLEDSQQGEILFEGEPVRWKGAGLNRRPADRAQVVRIRTNLSMVFQQFNLWAHMTVLQNVMEAP